MTDQQHPITPPQWQVDAWHKQAMAMGADVDAVLLEAVRWGYEQRGAVNEAELQKARDEELEACGKWLEAEYVVIYPNDLREWLEAEYGLIGLDDLRKHRRPKPSLKAQALDLLDRAEWNSMAENLGNEKMFGLNEIEIIRRALEALDG